MREVEQGRTQYGARHQVGGELDAPIVEPDGAGEGLREQGLGGARRAFEQDVSAREQRDRDHAGQLGLTEHGFRDLAFDRRAERLDAFRSEEHTSELQSLMRNSYAVFCLKTKKLKTKQ